MSTSNSNLFKQFARPILQPYANHSMRAKRQTSVIDTVIQYLLNRSSLQVTQVKISNATADTYTISIESRVTGTGPINSTVSAMDLELVFNGDCFGKLSLPEFKTNFWGATVSILDQKIDILDMAAHKAFVRSVIVDDETSFLLENGTCTIKAVGITAHCDYCLEVPLRGMMGPKFTLTRMNRIGETLTAEFQAENPSPVEIDHGASTFEIRNDKNETVAEMKGNLKIKRGSFKFRLRGTAKQGVAPSGKSRLVGIGVEDNSWCNETIQNIDVNFEIDSESLLLLSKQ